MAGSVTYYEGNYLAQTAVGTTGQLLQSNGASAPSWVDRPSTYFQAYNSTSFANATGDGTFFDLILDTAGINVGTAYSTVTGIFTAPNTGAYILGYNLILISALITGQISSFVLWKKNGSYVNEGQSDLNPTTVSDGGQWTQGNSSMIILAAGDTLQLSVRVTGGAKNVQVYSDGTASSYIFGEFIGA